MLRSSKSAQGSSNDEISLSEDGELTKKVLKEGSGNTIPQGALVAVHYTGRLADGTVFDDSWQRQRPFCFHVGHQKVIKGWDVGVKTMKLGESAILKCGPSYGYGSRAAGPIPPNSTLYFEVEIMDVKEDSEKYSNLLIISLGIMFLVIIFYTIFNWLYSQK